MSDFDYNLQLALGNDPGAARVDPCLCQVIECALPDDFDYNFQAPLPSET